MGSATVSGQAKGLLRAGAGRTGVSMKTQEPKVRVFNVYHWAEDVHLFLASNERL